MATEDNKNIFTLPASGDLSANFQELMKVNASGQAAVCDDADEPILGVLTNKPTAAGQPASIAGPGSIVKVKAGAAVNEGDKLTADSTGRAIATTTDTNHYAGIALTAVSNAGEVVEMLVAPGMVAG